MIKARTPKEYVKVPISDVRMYDIIYDVASIPAGTAVQDILQVYFKTGLLVYDSTKGEKPVFHDKKENNVQVKADGPTFDKVFPK